MLSPYKNSRSFEASLIFLAGLFLFTSGLFNHEFIGFESRFGLFAQEMLRNGISFFPTTYNKFYPDYPATQTILTYLFSLPFGKVTTLTAVLPTAIASAITLAFIYLIGALQTPRWGLYGVLFALLTFNFLAAARSIALDQFVTTATIASFYWVYSAHLLQNTRKLWYISIAWILGFAFRGPIGLIIPASVVCGFFLIEKNYKMFLLMGCSAISLLVICIISLLGLAWFEGGEAFVHAVINMQAAKRLAEPETTPFYYYFVAGFGSYALSFPIAACIFIAYAKQLVKINLNSDFSLLKHLCFWTLIILVGLSIPTAKKIRYILPLVPAVSLGAAYLFIAEQQNKFLQQLRKFVHALCISLPFIGLLLITSGKIFSHLKNYPLDIHFAAASMILIFLSVAIWLSKYDKNFTRQELVRFLLGTLAYVCIYIFIFQPIYVQLNGVQPFVTKVESLRKPNQQIVFYHVGPDGADIKFMVALNKPIQPQFLHQPEQLKNFKAPAIFIARKEDFDEFSITLKNQFNILFSDRLGHLPCVVFVAN